MRGFSFFGGWLRPRSPTLALKTTCSKSGPSIFSPVGGMRGFRCQIARVAIKEKGLLRQLGFRPAGRPRKKDAPSAPAGVATCFPS